MVVVVAAVVLEVVARDAGFFFDEPPEMAMPIPTMAATATAPMMMRRRDWAWRWTRRNSSRRAWRPSRLRSRFSVGTGREASAVSEGGEDATPLVPWPGGKL